jgi:hypothetical protein
MQRRKIFYVPGLISLVGLPILLLLFGPEEVIKPNALRLFLPSDEVAERGRASFSKASVYKQMEGKNIIAVHGEDYLSDVLERYRYNRKSAFIIREIERLQFTNDTNAVLKVEFSDDNSYGDFVWLLNQTILYGIKRYAFMDSSIYIFANPHVNHANYEMISVDPYTYESDLYREPDKWKKFISWYYEQLAIAQYMLRRNYLLAIGFLMLICLPAMKTLIRRNQTLTD